MVRTTTRSHSTHMCGQYIKSFPPPTPRKALEKGRGGDRLPLHNLAMVQLTQGGNVLATTGNLSSKLLPALYADDQILMATSEDDLQTMAYHLNLIARKYKITISSTKTKALEMWGNHIQGVKIVINDNITEQVTDFK